MNIKKDFDKIMDYAHMWNWVPDWDVVVKIYDQFPESYSVLTPFAYTYLEEMIRSTTSEYGIEILDNDGQPKKRKVGLTLVKLAITENSNNEQYCKLLESVKPHFSSSKRTDKGDNRNSVVHGYMHPRFWTQESFEELVHLIAELSPYAQF
jgi:hypothetical protein